MSRLQHQRSLVLIFCIFVSFGCRHVTNERHHVDDVVLHVQLQRSYAHAHAEMADSGRNFSGEDRDGFFEYFFALIIHCAVQSAIDHIPKTKFVIYPDCRTDYRQRLYWGDNTVFFPKDALIHETSPLGSDSNTGKMLIVISGDRECSKIFHFTTGKDQKVNLRK